MTRVLGVGGVFFHSTDPERLGRWYEQWLEVPVEHPHGATFRPGDLPANGFTAWAPFPSETKYFEPSQKTFMVNLVVDDLEGALAQVEKGGAEVVGEVEEYEYGRFGWFLDPEGNKVELWQPPE